MTSKDKPRDKLVGSMRKSKAVAGIATGSAETESATAAAVEETNVETKAERTAEKNSETIVETKVKAKTAAKSDGRIASTSQPAHGSVDSYQSGRRVWPD